MKKAAAARDMVLVAGLTAIAVTAFATNGAMSDPTWIPAPNIAQMSRPMIHDEPVDANAPLLRPTYALRSSPGS